MEEDAASRSRHATSVAVVGPATNVRPRVSVLVTAYNHEPFLAQALEGVLAQETSFPFEVVVGEDCSTDGTHRVLETFRNEHPQTFCLVLRAANLARPPRPPPPPESSLTTCRRRRRGSPACRRRRRGCGRHADRAVAPASAASGNLRPLDGFGFGDDLA